MPPKVKTEVERQPLRALIIDAARELFVAQGIHAVSIREITNKINYSATVLYNHIADKEAILQTVYDECF